MLSNEALQLLDELLANRVHEQVENGAADEPMPEAWTELHTFLLSQSGIRRY